METGIIGELKDRMRTIIALPEKPSEVQEFADWEVWLQPEGDLGQKLSGTMERAFTEGTDRVVLVDFSVLEVTADDIQAAFQRLDAVDVVLGPKQDGNVYMFGAKRMIPELFPAIDWSGEDVFGLALKSLCFTGVSIRLMEVK